MKGFYDPPVPFHPILAALVAPLVLAGSHVWFESPAVALRSILVIESCTIGFCAALAAVNKNLRAAAAAMTLVLIGFTVGGKLGQVLGIGSRDTRLAICAVVFCLAIPAARAKGRLHAVTQVANAFFLALVGLLIVSTVHRNGMARIPSVHRGAFDPVIESSRNSRPPDVFVLVLDGYGREDVLESRYGYRDPLTADLRERGFHVPPNACANYAETALSLAASLNLDYLPRLLDQTPADALSRRACGRLIQQNAAFRLLRSAGYRIITFASEYGVIRPENVDRELRRPWHLTEFEYNLYDMSAIPTLSTVVGLPPAWLPHIIRRIDVDWTLRTLSALQIRPDDRPTAVFAHILVPHPPFTFLPDGRYSWTRLPDTVWDGQVESPSSDGESYETGYLRNVQYLRSRLLPIVDSVLSNRARNTVFLIHADHGPGSRLDWDRPDWRAIEERMRILMAIRLPGATEAPRTTLTPINAMRLVLQHSIGAQLPLLDDRSLFSVRLHPYEFRDVTSRVQ